MSPIAARLERLPFSRFHFKLLVMGGLGFMFEAIDAAIIAFILPVVRTKWHLSSFETGILGSSTYVGFLIGALFAGLLGDRFGRRVVMMWALTFFCVMTFANAFVSDWHTFAALRAIAGIGMGAEGAIIAPFLVEFVSNRYRGAFTGALAGFFSFGFVAAALIGYFVIPLSPEGWRYALVLVSLPVIVLLWWRRSLHESPRWLEIRGRHAEAEAVVADIEQQVERTGVTLAPVTPVEGDAAATHGHSGSFFGNLRLLWKPPMAKTTLMSWCLWLSVTFCSYAFFVWIPGLLMQRGMTITKSFSVSILIYLAQIPGYYSSAYFCEKLGRKATIVTYMALACVAGIWLANAASDTSVVMASIFMSFAMNGVNAGEYAYTPEVFPTHLRATGMGTASAFGRIGAICSPMLVGYVYPIWGFAGVFGITTAILLFGALAVIFLGVSTSGKTLEEITAEEYGDGSADGNVNRLKTVR
ncbi:MFS transporter [Chitinasiproducens palmae]|uniref:MFS transporter, putative metabolite:H+ symporter n=1 Tax=Chitinasiproducens palmae TaxID=1770053 RepID=A0A1H2PRS7_9BURK|nr:MFS transporter [Chitinasiproducens palmae]SDV48826.1 MFS transporter, putative metabolite:H+ symporter [Chitinasiproducens palmae]